MPEAPLRQFIIATEGWLFEDLGFRVVWDHTDHERGGSVVNLESDALRLRFLRIQLKTPGEKARALTWAEVAPLAEPKSWWGIPDVVKVIRNEPREPLLSSLESPLRYIAKTGDVLNIAPLRWTDRGIERAPQPTLREAASKFRDNLDQLTDAVGPKWPEVKLELEERRRQLLRELTTPRAIPPVPLRVRLILAYMRKREHIRMALLTVGVALVVWIASR